MANYAVTETSKRVPSLPDEAIMRSARERVCVIIPMYRVAPYIQSVVAGIPDWIWRIIIVDDASPDDSATIVCSMYDQRVILLQHKQNQGVGGAMLTGFQKALELGASVAVKMDGDGQMSSVYLEDLVEPILSLQADYTKGNRFFHTKGISEMPLVRRIGNLGLSFLTKVASGYWNVFDPTNGYLAISSNMIKSLDQNRINKRYFFETSMLLELYMARAVVIDVPMPARYGGEVSSLSASRSLVEFSYYLLRGVVRRLWLQYFVLDFSIASLYFIVGFLLTLLGTAWGSFFWHQSIQTGVTVSTGTVMVAVLPVILGFQLLLQGVAYDIQNVPRIILRRHL